MLCSGMPIRYVQPCPDHTGRKPGYMSQKQITVRPAKIPAWTTKGSGTQNMPQQAPATQLKHSYRDQPAPETLAEWTVPPLGSTVTPVPVHFAWELGMYYCFTVRAACAQINFNLIKNLHALRSLCCQAFVHMQGPTAVKPNKKQCALPILLMLCTRKKISSHRK